MTQNELSERVNQLIERALDASDERLAAAERQFYQVAMIRRIRPSASWPGRLARRTPKPWLLPIGQAITWHK